MAPLKMELPLTLNTIRVAKNRARGQLHQGAAHVVHTDQQGLKAVLPLEYIYVILPAHELSGAQVLHIIEAELDHFQKRDIGKYNQKQQRHKHKGTDHQPPLHLSA